MDFIIDTKGSNNDGLTNYFSGKLNFPSILIKVFLNKRHKFVGNPNTTTTNMLVPKKSKAEKETEMYNKFFDKIGWSSSNKRKRKQIDMKDMIKNNDSSKKELEAVLKKSVITEDFEKLHAVPQHWSDKKLKKIRKVS